jgi:hypothetical protein
VIVKLTFNVPTVNPVAAQLIVNVPAVALAAQLNRPELLLILTPVGGLLVKLHVGLVIVSPLLLVAVYCILSAIPV